MQPRGSLSPLGPAGISPSLGHKIEHIKVQQIHNVPNKKEYESCADSFSLTKLY